MSGTNYLLTRRYPVIIVCARWRRCGFVNTADRRVHIKAVDFFCLCEHYQFIKNNSVTFGSKTVWLYVQTDPGTHRAAYTMATCSFPGIKRPGRGVSHPPPSSADVKERVELYFCSPSGSSWPLLGWNDYNIKVQKQTTGPLVLCWQWFMFRICTLVTLRYVDDGFSVTSVEYVLVITRVFFGLFTIFSVLMRSFLSHTWRFSIDWWCIWVRGHHIAHWLQ
jgi:hypothetical protein